jgi:hypothetical protein
MYGDWEAFAVMSIEVSEILFDGLNGSCVMIRRSTLERIGFLDERVQAADWDLYYTLRKREDELEMSNAARSSEAATHHFIRATVKGRREPFARTHPGFDSRQMVARRTRTVMVQVQYFRPVSGGVRFRSSCSVTSANRWKSW